MALSNIRVEPKREITESAIGIAVVMGATPIILLYLYGWYLLLHRFNSKLNIPEGMVIGVLLTVAILAVGMLLVCFTHFVGEEICDTLAKRGLDPRPKQRYEVRHVHTRNGDYVRKRIQVL